MNKSYMPRFATGTRVSFSPHKNFKANKFCPKLHTVGVIKGVWGATGRNRENVIYEVRWDGYEIRGSNESLMGEAALELESICVGRLSLYTRARELESEARHLRRLAENIAAHP